MLLETANVSFMLSFLVAGMVYHQGFRENAGKNSSPAFVCPGAFHTKRTCMQVL